MSEILTRLRGYNPPDRTHDSERIIAQDISDAADEIDRLRLALETATREAEEERRTAEAALKFLGRIAEVTWEAGLPGGDREQTLANVRALASRPAPPSDAVTEAEERPVLSVHSMHDTCDLCQRDIPDGCYAVFCGTCEDRLRDALSPAPAPPADAPPLPPGCTHDPSLVCLRCRVVIPMPAPPADAVREAADCRLCHCCLDAPDRHGEILGEWVERAEKAESALAALSSPAPAPSAPAMLRVPQGCRPMTKDESEAYGEVLDVLFDETKKGTKP